MGKERIIAIGKKVFRLCPNFKNFSPCVKVNTRVVCSRCKTPVCLAPFAGQKPPTGLETIQKYRYWRKKGFCSKCFRKEFRKGYSFDYLTIEGFLADFSISYP